MKAVIKYVSEDGYYFESEQNCLRHERTILLAKHVGENCMTTFDDDSGKFISSPRNIADYILKYIDDSKIYFLATGITKIKDIHF